MNYKKEPELFKDCAFTLLTRFDAIRNIYFEKTRKLRVPRGMRIRGRREATFHRRYQIVNITNLGTCSSRRDGIIR